MPLYEHVYLARQDASAQQVDAPAAALAEVERQERLSEDVLRYLTVCVDAHEEGPSAMMRKADRDRERDRDRDERRGFDRGDRGDRGERRRDRDGRPREGADEATAAADEE